MVDIHGLRDRSVAALAWSALSFQPGTRRRTAADGVAAKLRSPHVTFQAAVEEYDCLTDLIRFADATSGLSVSRLLTPGADIAENLEFGAAIAAEVKFYRSSVVTFDQVEWILEGYRSNGELAVDIRALRHEMHRAQWAFPCRVEESLAA